MTGRGKRNLNDASVFHESGSNTLMSGDMKMAPSVIMDIKKWN